MSAAINIFCEPSPTLADDLNNGNVDIPSNALMDNNGVPLLDQNGNFILVNVGLQITSVSPSPYSAASLSTLTVNGRGFSNNGNEILSINPGNGSNFGYSVQFVSTTQLIVTFYQFFYFGNYSINYTDTNGNLSNTVNLTVTA